MSGLHSRIRVSWKVLLIAVLAILGLVVPVYQLDKGLYANIERLDRERLSIKPIDKLLQSMASIQEMRGQAQLIAADKADGNAYQVLLAEVHKNLDYIAQSTLLDDSSKLSADLKELKTELDKTSADTLAERLSGRETFEKHTEMVMHVRGFIDDFAEVSGLSLDPEQATYYLMLVTVTHVPDLVQKLAQTRGLGISALSEGVGSGEKRGQMRGMLGDSDRITFFMLRDLARAYSHSATMKARLDSKAQAVVADTVQLRALSFKEVLEAEFYTMQPEAFFNAYTSVLDRVLAFNAEALQTLDEQLVQQRADYSARFTRSLALSVLAVVLMIVVLWWIGRSILQAYRETSAAANALASGNLTHQIKMAGDRDTIALLTNIQQMQQQLRGRLQEAMRLRRALDSASTNIMLADEQNVIIYANQAVQQMFKVAERDIRQDLPQFNADNVVGGSVDQFHKNPAYQQGMLSKMTAPHHAQINIGPRTMAFIATPVFDQDNTRLGTVVEWRDRTEELAALEAEQLRQEELEKIADYNAQIKSALDNVSANVMIANTKREITYMNRAVQSLLSDSEKDIRIDLPNFNASKLMGAKIEGLHKNADHQARVYDQLSGNHREQVLLGGRTFLLDASPVFDEEGDRLGTAVQWTDRTNEVRVEKEVGDLVNAAASGDFKQRLDMAGKEGFFKRLSEDLNRLMGSVAEGLEDLQRMLEATAKGDMTARISKDYAGIFADLKTYSNQSSESLSDMLGQIREAVDTIFTAASEIAQGNADLSSRTEQQASSLEETASSMEELTSTVRNNADNARQANALAMNASQVAVAGGDVVQKVVLTMSAINESARKIADIIGVIDGIAFQTNILALNAAVEAARAGEQGRGFAVVAAEVRNLAQRSAGAAKEIKSLIENSVEKVESGNELVAKAGNTMSDIVQSIQKVTDIMADIAAASAEQSTGIEEVNRAVSQMDEMTQQNAALVEQAAASAEALQGQSNMLSQAVSVFKLDNRVAAAPSLAHAKPAHAAKPMPASRALPKVNRNAEDEWEEF
ncbi:methyl-accepting chemotaxis protein [Atopomonas sediminilitoris]|uniref:methyl-accepting chemotaxis protein n=1 Tax=Atopomonas sediminilitoris TaxID=2919919 RepID=UPI00351FD826